MNEPKLASIELSEYQARLLITAIEKEGFRLARQAADFQNLQILNNAKDLFSIANQYRNIVGWPERDDTKNTAAG